MPENIRCCCTLALLLTKSIGDIPDEDEHKEKQEESKPDWESNMDPEKEWLGEESYWKACME